MKNDIIYLRIHITIILFFLAVFSYIVYKNVVRVGELEDRVKILEIKEAK